MDGLHVSFGLQALLENMISDYNVEIRISCDNLQYQNHYFANCLSLSLITFNNRNARHKMFETKSNVELILDEDIIALVDKNVESYRIKWSRQYPAGLPTKAWDTKCKPKFGFFSTINWAAFFLPTVWPFYRRMYSSGFALLFFMILIYVFQGYFETDLFSAMIGLNIIAGFQANWLYSNHVIGLKNKGYDLHNNSEERLIFYKKKGGVSIKSGIFAMAASILIIVANIIITMPAIAINDDGALSNHPAQSSSAPDDTSGEKFLTNNATSQIETLLSGAWIQHQDDSTPVEELVTDANLVSFNFDLVNNHKSFVVFDETFNITSTKHDKHNSSYHIHFVSKYDRPASIQLSYDTQNPDRISVTINMGITESKHETNTFTLERVHQL